MPWRKGNRLRLVPEAQAPPRTAQIYRELREALGLPFVPVIYQALGVYPTFLDLHWSAFRPVVLTREFFHYGECLRADAYTRAFNYLQVPDLCPNLSSPDKKQIDDLVELLHYKNSVLMLIVAAQFQAFDATIGRLSIDVSSAEHPVFAEAPTLVDEQRAAANVRATFEDIRRTIGVPHVSHDWRALARWPQFLLSFWTTIKKLHASPMFEGSLYAVRETAWSLARELPHPIELTLAHVADAGMTDEEISSIGRLIELFVKNLSVLVLTSAMARIGLDGGTPVYHAAPAIADRSTPDEAEHAKPKPKDDKEQAA